MKRLFNLCWLILTSLLMMSAASADIIGEQYRGVIRYYENSTNETVDVIAPVFLNEDFIIPVSGAVNPASAAFEVINTGSGGIAINAQEHGVIRATVTNASGNNLEMASELIFRASNYCSAEARIKVGDVTNAVVFGFTDAQTEGASLLPVNLFGTGTTPTVVSTASDFAGFVQDSGATNDGWWAISVDSDSDGTLTTGGVAADSSQWVYLRVDLDADGNADYFVNGYHRYRDTSVGITPTTALCVYLGVMNRNGIVNPNTTVDIDYIRAWQSRPQTITIDE